MSDEQLTIAGLPTDRGRRNSRGARSIRSNPRPRPPMPGDGVYEVPDLAGHGPGGAAARGSASSRALGVHDVDALGVRTDLVTACWIALGVGSTTAYALAGRGELPFPAYRVGRQWVVPTAGLRAFLGLPQQESTKPVTP